MTEHNTQAYASDTIAPPIDLFQPHEHAATEVEAGFMAPLAVAMRYDPNMPDIERIAHVNKMVRTVMRADKQADEKWTDEDQQTLEDTVEGEVDRAPKDLIRSFCSALIDHEAVAPGIDAKVGDLRARKSRAARKIELFRALTEQVMLIMGWNTTKQKLVLDIATVSTRPATAQIAVTDETMIPPKFWKRPDPVLDKATLRADVLGRYRALEKALSIKDQTDREKALAQVQMDFGDEIPGCAVKIEGHTTTISLG